MGSFARQRTTEDRFGRAMLLEKARHSSSMRWFLVNVCYRLYAEAEFAQHHESTTWPPHPYTLLVKESSAHGSVGG